MICEEVEHVCGFRTERDLVGDVHSYEVRERIVRCRDCEHAYEIDGTDELNCLYFNDWDYRNDCPDEWRVEPDGFCAWGEERGDDRD